MYTRDHFPTEVRRLTGGIGVDVVYDSVGKTTLAGSLDCLKPRGYLVAFGNASGPPPDVSPLTLMRKGSLYLTRPTLDNYVASREEIAGRWADVCRWVAERSLSVRVAKTYPLDAAADAHRDLESRRLSGKLLLIV